MKLQLELLGAIDGIPELKTDVADMEHMLEGYLAFARGEGGEASVPTNVTSLINEVVVQARRKGNEIDLHIEGDIQVAIRPIAFKRCLTNLIDNSIRYANYVSVRAGRRNDAIEITIDDDGPGISTDKREEVFRPFYRIDGSRNPVTGGVGLGLTIARDVARSHGGDIELADSPSGGLRARLRLPL
jgi:two-component system osmolarity sensor histidine kinase EnvZ